MRSFRWIEGKGSDVKMGERGRQCARRQRREGTTHREHRFIAVIGTPKSLIRSRLRVEGTLREAGGEGEKPDKRKKPTKVKEDRVESQRSEREAAREPRVDELC